MLRLREAFLLQAWLLLRIWTSSAAYHSLEVLECDHHDGHIIERLPHQTVLQHTLYTQSRELVHANILALLVVLVGLVYLCLLGRVAAEPDTAVDVFVSELVEDAITCKNNEVVLLRYLMDFNIRFCYDNIWIASSVFKFSFWITESAAN